MVKNIRRFLHFNDDAILFIIYLPHNNVRLLRVYSHIFTRYKYGTLYLLLHAKGFFNSIRCYVKEINDKDCWVVSHLDGLFLAT